MNPFESKNANIIVVHNDELHFILVEPSGDWKIFPSSCSIDQIIDEEDTLAFVPQPIQNRMVPLIIVPDYWLGNVSYDFRSKKRSLAETFIERKLLSENPDLDDVQNFYEYAFYQSGREGKGVFVQPSMLTKRLEEELTKYEEHS